MTQFSSGSRPLHRVDSGNILAIMKSAKEAPIVEIAFDNLSEPARVALGYSWNGHDVQQ